MQSVFIEFPSNSTALLFLKRTSPPSITAAWDRLKLITIYPAMDSVASVFLETPSDWLGNDFQAMVQRCEGTVTAAQQREIKFPMQEFFRHVRLEPNDHTELSKCFLIVPLSEKRQHAEGLIAALAELEGWAVWIRIVTDQQGERETDVYELHTLSNQPLTAPSGLPGAPLVLASLAEDIFVPSGFTLPLLPAYRFLLPPQNRETLHIWSSDINGEPRYQPRRKVGESLQSLARVVFLDGNKLAAERIGGETGRVQVPLELRPMHSRRPLKRAEQVIYRVESKAGEFGPALLRILDHCEARIEDFTYFGRSLGEGPNATVEHYLQADARLVDEDFWPELQRFDWPRTLAELDIPLFVPAHADIVPDIDGLVSSIEAEDPFLSALRNAVGLEPGNVTRVAIVESSNDPRRWRVLHLEEGRPLQTVISPIVQAFNREPIRRATSFQGINLNEDRAIYEDHWNAAGEHESRELANATKTLCQELVSFAKQVDEELGHLTRRVSNAREVTGPIVDLLTELPRTLQEFANRTAEILGAVAGPRQEWFSRIDQREHQLTQIQENARILAQDAQQRVGQMTRAVEAGTNNLNTAQQSLQTAETNLNNLANDLPPLVQSANESAAQLRTAIQGREAQLQSTLRAVAQRESELAVESQRVDAFQRDVEQRERRVQEWTRQLAARRQTLENRLRSAEEEARRAEAETNRLDTLEQVDIPAAERRARAADEELARICARKVEERFRATSSKAQDAEERLETLRAQEANLIRLETRLTEDLGAIPRLEARIAELKAAMLDQRITEAECKKQALAATIGNVEAACLAARQAQAALRAAEEALTKVRSDQNFLEMKTRLETLHEQIQSAIQEADAARPEKRSSDIQYSLIKIEAEVRNIRHQLGIRRFWFWRY